MFTKQEWEVRPQCLELRWAAAYVLHTCPKNLTMALAGKHAMRGLGHSPLSAVLPRVVSSCTHPSAPRHTQLLKCKATIELPPGLQAELDELEKAAHCGSEGEVFFS